MFDARKHRNKGATASTALATLFRDHVFFLVPMELAQCCSAMGVAYRGRWDKERAMLAAQFQALAPLRCQWMQFQRHCHVLHEMRCRSWGLPLWVGGHDYVALLDRLAECLHDPDLPHLPDPMEVFYFSLHVPHIRILTRALEAWYIRHHCCTVSQLTHGMERYWETILQWAL